MSKVGEIKGVGLREIVTHLCLIVWVRSAEARERVMNYDSHRPHWR
jgi:hypothetical protein